MAFVNTGSPYFNRATTCKSGPCVTIDKEPLPLSMAVYIDETRGRPAVVLKDPIREIVHGRAFLGEGGSGMECVDGFYNNIPGAEAEILMASVLTIISDTEQTGVMKMAAITLCDFQSEGAVIANGHSVRIDLDAIAPIIEKAQEILGMQVLEEKLVFAA